MLSERRRTQLDGIVAKMIANKESDETVQFVVDDFKKKYSNQELSPTTQPERTEAPDTYNATFPASPNDTPLIAGAKALGNVPSSAYTFGKSTFQAVRHPIQTLEGVGAILGGGIKKAAVALGAPDVPVVSEEEDARNAAAFAAFSRSLKDRYGSLENLQRTATNDPFGFGTDLMTVALGGAGLAAKGSEAANAISKTAGIVTKPAGMLTRNAGKAGAQILGATTGTGASSVTEAFKSASEGGQASRVLTQAMRGRTEPQSVIRDVENVVQSIKSQRGSAYLNDLRAIGEDRTTHNIQPVLDELQVQLKNFGVKETKDGLDFSRSSIANNSSARADIAGVYDTLKTWGTKPGDRTGIGLDLLKKQLGDFYTQSGQARAFVQAVKSKVSAILQQEVPGYAKMTAKYQETSDLLDDIKSATGVGTNSKPDTIFTKLTTAMKGDKEFRLDVLRQVKQTDPTIMNKIAGINFNSWIPRGLVGKGADIGTAFALVYGHFNPNLIPLLLSTSPRVVGEFVRGLGVSANVTNQLIKAVNDLSKSEMAAPAAIVSVLLSNLSPAPMRE